MTIEIGDPEIERIVNDAIRTGQYGSAQEVITEAVSAWYGQRLSALATRTPKERPFHPHANNLVELFASSPFKGMNMEFERDRDTGRDIAL